MHVNARTRRWWLLIVTLVVGLLALGVGVCLVLHAASSTAEKVARGTRQSHEATPAAVGPISVHDILLAGLRC